MITKKIYDQTLANRHCIVLGSVDAGKTSLVHAISHVIQTRQCGKIITPLKENEKKEGNEKKEQDDDDIFGNDGEVFDMMMGEFDVKKNAKNLMEYSEQISISGYEGLFDKQNKMAAKVIVLFNDNTVKSKIVKNNRACAKGNKTLRRHCLQIRP